MTKYFARTLPLLLPLALLAAAPAGAQATKGNTPGATDSRPSLSPAPPVDVKYEQKVECVANAPQEITGYYVVCAGASYLDFAIADCCIPGDHWQLKGKVWDGNPNTAVTTAPGGAGILGVAGRIYNYGGTPSNPAGLNAYVECSYPHGVNVFPAGSTVLFTSDGACTLTQDPVVRRIDRTP
ncbi:MAG TPA: hypothetical protein VF173_01735 [Thermoanaerobaculia bacterium]|nr:hypothetical protein [Thermoanaerobaculia bacterium]